MDYSLLFKYCGISFVTLLESLLSLLNASAWAPRVKKKKKERCPGHPLDHLPVISKVHQAPISSISSVTNTLSRQTDVLAR